MLPGGGGGGGRGTWLWTLPSRTHWASGTRGWGSAASQSSVPMVGSRGLAAPTGREQEPPSRKQHRMVPACWRGRCHLQVLREEAGPEDH